MERSSENPSADEVCVGELAREMVVDHKGSWFRNSRWMGPQGVGVATDAGQSLFLLRYIPTSSTYSTYTVYTTLRFRQLAPLAMMDTIREACCCSIDSSNYYNSKLWALTGRYM